MYEYLRGTLAAKDPTAAIVEAGGIGYRVLISQGTYDALGGKGSEALLWLHALLLAEQGEQRLYGFSELKERALFRQLLNVQRVGPAMAMKVLSAAGYDTLISSIAGGNVDALKRVKGVGAKMAERLVVELQEPLSKLGFIVSSAAAGEAPRAPLSSIEAEAIQALVGLGNTPKEAERVVRKANSGNDFDDVGDLIRAALRSL
ncbi:MAG: Holliday junction branch migration protein RuvA [Planctomycetes bacterium]|nr:Holliday junction branch migration protein RuvA [Planctomycetota bacterium]